MSDKVNEFTNYYKLNTIVLESIEEGLEDNDTVLINDVKKSKQINVKIKVLKPSVDPVITFKEDESLVKCIVRVVMESIENI
jgi:hypothetical protein